uniref:ribosomal protein S3 n=1 Tax=Caulacanthus ustulatus TaxID=31411 RepID=UPI00300240AC|nr:ribosomal protein S3 [Caulacanthus ustulatus]
MAQKINPLSFRIGTIQLWNSYIQIYGKLKQPFLLILHKYLKSYTYLSRASNYIGFLIDYQEWKISKSIIKVNLYYQCFPQILIKRNFQQFFLLHKTLFLTKVSVRFYLRSSWSLSNKLIESYFQYLLDANISPNKIMLILRKFLVVCLNSKKIAFFKYGIVNLKLSGFKLRISGRFEDSKSQMAKSVEETSGHLPLTSVKNYVIYSNNHIYTKSGVCGLKIWLFYTIR